MQETYWYRGEIGWQRTTKRSYQRIKAHGGEVRLGSEGGPPRQTRRRGAYDGDALRKLNPREKGKRRVKA